MSRTLKKISYHIDTIKKKLVRNIYSLVYSSRLKNKDFAIISNNCWGGGIYQITKSPYNTPFIGLFINAPCYIKFLRNPDYYLNQNIEFVKKSKYLHLNTLQKYPIGCLSDIEIHFLHYKSEDEATKKWTRRCQRLPSKDSWYIKFDDRDNFEETHIHEFHQLSYKNKISFTKKKYEYELNLKLKNKDDLILFHTTYDLMDIIHWINTTEVKKPNGFLLVIQTLLKYYPKY
ncbi:MAG: DUF1919 domain-containing protein [Bacteroidetes bacterium]|nr:DUF1919 domain-containing protein [Bacteroidota bacterium]